MNENDFDDGLQQVLVCTYGEDCANASKSRYGSDTAAFDALKLARKAAGFNRKLSVLKTSCQGWCQYAPVCAVMPEGRVFHDITPEDAADFAHAVVAHDEAAFANKQVWKIR